MCFIEKVMFQQNLEGGPCAYLIKDNIRGGEESQAFLVSMAMAPMWPGQNEQKVKEVKKKERENGVPRSECVWLDGPCKDTGFCWEMGNYSSTLNITATCSHLCLKRKLVSSVKAKCIHPEACTNPSNRGHPMSSLENFDVISYNIEWIYNYLKIKKNWMNRKSRYRNCWHLRDPF